MRRKNSVSLLLVVLAVMFSVSYAAAQSGTQLAQITNDEGGPIRIVGDGDYTFPYFRTFLPQPYVLLNDIAGMVERDFNYYAQPESQVFGIVTSDPFEPPFSFELNLPFEPRGQLRDVDNNGGEDSGVMIFAITLVSNTWGDPYMEERDFFISGVLQSVLLSEESEDLNEIRGGKLLIFAPEEGQGFPSGYGDDGLLFTDDDPVVILPQGYTVVDLDSAPFTFDRSRTGVIDLLEADGAQLDDFSELSYLDSFDAMIDLLRREYAFTEYKGLDWTAFNDEFRPRVAAADARRDRGMFELVLRDLAWAIPDGHVSGPYPVARFQQETFGGLGITVVELDDGRVIVDSVTPGSIAERNGITLRTEIIEVNGVAVSDAISANVPWTSPHSTDHARRLAQTAFFLRFPVGRLVDLVYRNPDETQPRSASLNALQDVDTLVRILFGDDSTVPVQPVEFEILPSGFGLVRFYSFADDLPLTVALWERMIQVMNNSSVPGIIIDMRQNGGGAGYLADQLPAYFFNDPLVLGNTGSFSAVLGDFFFDERLQDQFVLPDESLRYNGDIAVLVSPDCASACEFFTYHMTLQGRAAIVGQYPTAGLGGPVVPISMPDGLEFRYTNGRSVDPQGNIHIEGIGVVPDVRVPVTEETVFSDGDPILEAAIEYLRNNTITNGGAIAVGESRDGTVQAGRRVRYTLQVPEDMSLDFIVTGGNGRLDTVLRIYLPDDDVPAFENDDDGATLNSGLYGIGVRGGLTLIIEIGTYQDSSQGDFTLTVRESQD